MKAFNTSDVADYYDQTLIHYKQWWNLKESHSLHYGFWLPDTKNFKEALVNTNKIMAEKAQIAPSDLVLDAGCGVGGAAMYLAESLGCTVTGITLSGKQVEFANASIRERQLEEKVQVLQADYTQTGFDSDFYDICWACESSSSAVQKSDFACEMFRVLKPGGRLVLTDFFWPEPDMPDSNNYMKKWGDTWGISGFDDLKTFISHLNDAGFQLKEQIDYTNEVYPSAKKMYRSYRLGALGSRIYNILNGQKVSRFARTHFLCGKYQYKALEKGLWKYYLLVAEKPA